MDLIKKNETIFVVAQKNRHALPAQVEDTYKTVNDTIGHVNKLARIPEVIKAAKVAKVAREQRELVQSALNVYRADLEVQKLEFHKVVVDLTKPNGAHEIMEQQSLRDHLLNGNALVRDAVYSDPQVAKVAYRLPPTIKAKMNLKDEVLLEAVFDGYNGEIKRFDDLLANCDRAEQSLDNSLLPLMDDDAERTLVEFQRA